MTKRDYRSAAGFSLVEMMIVVGLASVMTGMAVVQIGNSRPAMKGDGAMRVILGQMNQARQIAIQQRRYVRVVLTTPLNPSTACPSPAYCIQLIREDTTTTGACAATCTSLASVFIEGNVQFGLIVATDTPDGFAAFAFGTPSSLTNVKFAPNGTLVNQDGALTNGTVFLAIPNTALSSRAVTVLGSTGRVRGYRWDGKQWNVV